MPSPNQPTNAELIEALAYRLKYQKIESLFPEKGKLRRELYKKHCQWFQAGGHYRQRLFIAANRVGKTTAAGVELSYHLTGLYPKWWKGYRFTRANDWWLCGEDTGLIREIYQPLMLGKTGDFGTGLIPKHLLNFDSMTNARKGETLIQTYQVKHVTGEWSTCTLKSYESGREAFQGTQKNIWLDEEPPYDIYQECLYRTTDTGQGDAPLLMMTFTPMKGLTQTVTEFLGKDVNILDGEISADRWCTNVSIYDVPHIDKKERERLERETPSYYKNARIKGIPFMGAGLVYPFEAEKMFCEPFPIPAHYKRVLALDFGYNPDPTGILWGAIDPDTGTLYIYKDYLEKEQPVSVHAGVLRAMDNNTGYPIPKCCDPSGGSSYEGKTLRDRYAADHQLYFVNADNGAGGGGIHSGIQITFDEFNSGKIKVFNTCSALKKELGSYYRKENGKYAGADHLMDCLRYLVMTGRKIAKSLAAYQAEQVFEDDRSANEAYDMRRGVIDWWLYQ